MLDEQFSEDETLRQLETAINWGRYAELFAYDAARRRFIQRLERRIAPGNRPVAIPGDDQGSYGRELDRRARLFP